MRPIAIIFALSSLLVGAALAWGFAFLTLNWAENEQKNEMEQALAAGGIDWAQVSVDGTLVTLAGTAAQPGEKERAAMIAKMIAGENLNDQSALLQPEEQVAQAQQPWLEILKNDEQVSLMGMLPKDSAQDDLIDTILTLDRVALIDLSESINSTGGPDWPEALHFAGRILALTDRSIITVTPGRVEVNTVAGSETWQDGLAELLDNIRPEGVELMLDIAAPRQVISPYVFQADLGGQTPVQCSARDEAEALAIKTSMQEMGLSVDDCTVGLGAPSNQWREVVELCTKALENAGGGQLSIVDTAIDLTAPYDADPEALAALGAQLPDSFSLNVTIQDPPVQASVAAQIVPAHFGAELAEDGTVLLIGTMKDDLTRAAVLRYAQAKFGYNLVEDDFTLQTQLPDHWQTRIFASLEALALLDKGLLAVTRDTLTLSGVAGFENPEAEIRAILDPVFGPETNVSLDLTYVPGAVVQQDALDPRICASRVTTLLAANQISFAPSSAVIEDSSAPTIEAIAAILTKCRDTRFEIGGHTDSQGREEMNLSLSQARADAVLDALLAQNLLLGDIVAVGYGESEPIADNSTEEGRAANRRIVIKMLRDAEDQPEPEVDNEQN